MFLSGGSRGGGASRSWCARSHNPLRLPPFENPGSAPCTTCTLLCESSILLLKMQTYYIYSLNAHAWKSILFGLGVKVGRVSLRFGIEINAEDSGIHSQKSDLNPYFGVDYIYMHTKHLEWIKLQNWSDPRNDSKKRERKYACGTEYIAWSLHCSSSHGLNLMSMNLFIDPYIQWHTPLHAKIFIYTKKKKVIHGHSFVYLYCNISWIITIHFIAKKGMFDKKKKKKKKTVKYFPRIVLNKITLLIS